MQKKERVRQIRTDSNDWPFWHGRLVRYWQSIGVQPGSGLVNPFNGDVYTIANLLEELEYESKRLGLSRCEFAFRYLYIVSLHKIPTDDEFKKFDETAV